MYRSYKKVFDIVLLTMISTLLLLPLVLLAVFSLQTFESIGFGDFNHWTLENYPKSMAGLLPSLLFTLSIILFSSLFTIFFSITAAFAMSQLDFKFKKVLSWIILIPIFIPGSSIIASEYKLINSMGLTTGTFGFMIGLSLPFCYSYLSYAIIKSGYDNIEPNLKKKAITDNVSSFDYFILTLGNVKNEVIWVVLITCMSTWNSYLYPRIILMGTDLRVITLWLYDVSIDSTDYLIHQEIQAAASIIASIPLIIFMVVFRRRILSSLKSF